MPIVIAHRGASAYLPEHTLMSKALAHSMEVDFLEQDCVASKDGVPVVLHDVHIDTVTNVAKVFPDRKRNDGRYYAFDFTVAELKELRVFERFDHRTGEAVYPLRYPVGHGDFQLVTLDEELQFIANLNRTTGRSVGIYPEIKRPVWHREQGVDLSVNMLRVLTNHGYTQKSDPCYLQCFDEAEVIRVRDELGYQGLLIQLVYVGHDKESGTDYERLKSADGMARAARVADGLGPPIDGIVTWSADGKPNVTGFVQQAHSAGLDVHPWTLRADSLPENCPSVDDLLRALFRSAGVDGLFADHPDLAVKFKNANENAR